MSTEQDLLSRYPNAQWKVDNLEEIEHLLRDHEARCQLDENDTLLLQGWGGLDTRLNPGDCLILDGSRLGIIRAKTDDAAPSDTAH